MRSSQKDIQRISERLSKTLSKIDDAMGTVEERVEEYNERFQDYIKIASDYGNSLKNSIEIAEANMLSMDAYYASLENQKLERNILAQELEVELADLSKKDSELKIVLEKERDKDRTSKKCMEMEREYWEFYSDIVKKKAEFSVACTLSNVTENLISAYSETRKGIVGALENSKTAFKEYSEKFESLRDRAEKDKS